MSASNLGPVSWSLEVNEDGHRTYKLRSLVRQNVTDGPYIAMTCPGLPIIGTPWIQGSDVDAWAYCLPNMTITPVDSKQGPGEHWYVEQTFSTKPLYRCQTATIEDPMSEPPKLSGSFVKLTKEYPYKPDGTLLMNVAFERLKGPQIERDESRPNVSVEMNLTTLPLSTYYTVVDTINDAPLWGLPARYIKLGNVSWERKLYGTCTYYYTVKYEFEINPKTWDRKIPNEGSKCLKGWGNAVAKPPGYDAAVAALVPPATLKGAMASYKAFLDNRMDPDATVDIGGGTMVANYLIPNNYIQMKDSQGENTRAQLDTKGRPLGCPVNPDGTPGTTAPVLLDWEPYETSNLLLLGIPTSL